MISLDYTTGQISRDFSFIEEGSICELLSPIRSLVGGDGCSRCGYNKGRYSGREGSCILCNHPKTKDSPETWMLRYQYMEEFKNQAYCYYYS